jgi:hypothetical protein
MADIFDINDRRSFYHRQIAVTLTGAEWVAFLARTVEKPLSPAGKETYCVAAAKVCDQLTAVSAECLKAGRG